MSGLRPIPAAPERKQPRLLLGRSVPNRKSSGVRKAPGPARSGWNSRSRPRTPIQPPPGPGSSAPPAPECTYASYTNPQHHQRVFWAGSSNSTPCPPAPCEMYRPIRPRENPWGGSRIVADSALSHGRSPGALSARGTAAAATRTQAHPGGPLLCSTPTRTGGRAVLTPTQGGGNARAASATGADGGAWDAEGRGRGTREEAASAAAGRDRPHVAHDAQSHSPCAPLPQVRAPPSERAPECRVPACITYRPLLRRRHATVGWDEVAGTRKGVTAWETTSQTLLDKALDFSCASRGCTKPLAYKSCKIIAPCKEKPSEMLACAVVPARISHKVDKGRRVMTIECNRAYFTPVRAHARALPRLCSPSCLCCRRGCS